MRERFARGRIFDGSQSPEDAIHPSRFSHHGPTQQAKPGADSPDENDRDRTEGSSITRARHGGNVSATRRRDQTCEGPRLNPMSAAD